MKIIIFDFGGIFNIDDDVQEFWQHNAKYFNVDAEKANKITLDIWMDVRIGKSDSNLFWSEAGKFVGLSAEEFKKYFIEYTGFRDEFYDFVKNELRGKYKLAMITNQMKSWFETVLETKDFREVFDVITTSYEAKIAKPDIRIYKQTLENLGVEPQDCIYIDDREKNLEPARELGMETILFRDVDSFKKELYKLL